MRLDREPTIVVASDLDGTLLTSDHRITDRTRDAVGLVRSVGGVFVAVTARPLRDAAWIAEAVGADFLLCAGGGVLFDPALGEVVRTTTFAADHATRLITVLRAAFPDVRLGLDYLDRCDLDPGFDLGKPGAAADVVGAARVGVPVEPVLKLIAQSDSIDTDTLAVRARDLFGRADAPIIEVSCRAFVDVLPFGVHKASQLALLRTGPPTVAFGDMPGDLPMLRWADTSVAMANAHPAVLAACHHVTGPNDEDGVAVFLERLLADRLPSAG